jgi:hypothetical protein
MSYKDFGYNDFLTKRIFSDKNSGLKNRATLFSGSISNQLLGANSVTDVKVRDISASKLTAGTVSVIANLGDESIGLDGENRRILVTDEDGFPRVLIGYDASGF